MNLVAVGVGSELDVAVQSALLCATWSAATLGMHQLPEFSPDVGLTIERPNYRCQGHHL